MDQPPLAQVSDSSSSIEKQKVVPLPFFSADEAEAGREEAFVVVVQNALEFCQWIQVDAPKLQWIQVENLLHEPEAWATASRKGNSVPLDVIVDNPGVDYAALYNLVDVRVIRSVRVTIPLRPGFLRSLRLAASIQLPVRLLPGHPGEEMIEELIEATEFYLRDPMVETPVEFFHSALASARGLPSLDLWSATERDPDLFASPSCPEGARPGFVAQHLEQLEKSNAECVSCHWRDFCGGFFKNPDPTYSCSGILRVFDRIGEAAKEMNRDFEAISKDPETDPNSKT